MTITKGELSLVVFKQKAMLNARKTVLWTKFYASLIQYGKNLNISTQSCACHCNFTYIYICIWIYFPSWLVIFPSHQLQKTRGSVEAASVSYIKMHESKTAPPWSPSPYHHKQLMSRYRWPKPEQFKMCRHHQHNSDIRQISRSYTRALSPRHSRVRRERHHAVRFSCITPVKQITQKVFCSFLFCPYSSPPSPRFYHPEVSQVQSVSFFLWEHLSVWWKMKNIQIQAQCFTGKIYNAE